MAKYRSKPKVVEAEQWFPNMGRQGGVDYDGDMYYVVTIHGQKTLVEEGDWIITEPDGVHHYPCKPDIFEASYEPVE